MAILSWSQPIEVFLPHPFSYTLLKLFALRDQIDNEGKEFGRHHAFDVYNNLGNDDGGGVRPSGKTRIQYADVDVMSEAIRIANTLFADENAKGMIRLKEHARIQNVELIDIGEFIKDIRTLFLRDA